MKTSKREADKLPKATAKDWEYRNAWSKYVLHYGDDLPEGYDWHTLLAYAFAMAEGGSAGRDCFSSDTTIGVQLRLTRTTVAKYRHLALDLGWFTVSLKPDGTPRRQRRGDHLDIHIPVNASDVRHLPQGSNASDGNPDGAVNASGVRHYQGVPYGTPKDQADCKHLSRGPFRDDRCWDCGAEGLPPLMTSTTGDS